MAHGPDTRKLQSYLRESEQSGVLIIERLKLTSLPEFPENLQTLKIIGTQIKFLPKLPASITFLVCGNMKELTSIPELPAGILMLSVRDCPKINALPELPNKLVSLEIRNTSILSLPSELPAKLRELDISNTNISALPELPSKLERLNIHNTKITILPELPAGLLYLITDNAPLMIQMNPEEKIQDYNLRWRNWKIENAELNKQKRYNVGKALEQRGVPGTSATGPLKNILGFAGIPAPAKGTGRRKRKSRKTRRNRK